jgi:hypothetical protein
MRRCENVLVLLQKDGADGLRAPPCDEGSDPGEPLFAEPVPPELAY